MDIAVLAILTILGVLPPLVFLVWMRNRERTEREPYGALLLVFFYGATIGIVTAFVLNTIFQTTTWLYTGDAVRADILTAVISAPFIEEAIKASGLGLRRVRAHLTEHEDGIVYGAAVGLGFAMSENLFYGFGSLQESAEVAVLVMVLRVFSSTILHAGASALVGFGVSHTKLRNEAWPRIIPYYLLAVAVHAAYNVLVTIIPIAGFLAALLIVWVLLGLMRRKIRTLEGLPHQARVARVPADAGRPPKP